MSQDTTLSEGRFIPPADACIIPLGSEAQPRRIPQRLVLQKKTVIFPAASPCERPLNTYKIVRYIGQGTYGQVYLCRSADAPGRLFAVKVVRALPEYEAQALCEVAMLCEVLAAGYSTVDPSLLINSALENNTSEYNGLLRGGIARIVTYFFADSSAGRHLCIVTPFYGLDLLTLLHRQAPIVHRLPIDVLRVVTQQLCTALGNLHSLGICHCDLKPENILITFPSHCLVDDHLVPIPDDAMERLADYGACRNPAYKGSTPSIVLIDVGSAVYVSSQSTQGPHYIQSRFYRAPEVLLGMPFNEAVDIWSLGCVVVELFKGSPLFGGSDAWDMMARIMGLECSYEPYRLQNTLRFLVRAPRGPLFFSGLSSYSVAFQRNRLKPENSCFTDLELAQDVISGSVDAQSPFRIQASLSPVAKPVLPVLRTRNEYCRHAKIAVTGSQNPEAYHMTLEGVLLHSLSRDYPLTATITSAVSNNILEDGPTTTDLRLLAHFIQHTLTLDPELRLRAHQLSFHPFLDYVSTPYSQSTPVLQAPSPIQPTPPSFTPRAAGDPESLTPQSAFVLLQRWNSQIVRDFSIRNSPREGSVLMSSPSSDAAFPAPGSSRFPSMELSDYPKQLF